MNEKETEKIRNRLKKERNDILKEVKRIKDKETSYLNEKVGDDIDRASDNSHREILFYLNEYDRLKLDAVEDALAKIDAKQFGSCEQLHTSVISSFVQCNKKITKARLNAIPYAKLCIKCKPVSEKNNVEM